MLQALPPVIDWQSHFTSVPRQSQGTIAGCYNVYKGETLAVDQLI